MNYLANVRTTLGAAFAPGATTLQAAAGYGAAIGDMLTGSGLGSLSSGNPVDLVLNDTRGEVVFHATGLAGDVFSGAITAGTVPSGGFPVGTSVTSSAVSAATRGVLADNASAAISRVSSSPAFYSQFGSPGLRRPGLPG